MTIRTEDPCFSRVFIFILGIFISSLLLVSFFISIPDNKDYLIYLFYFFGSIGLFLIIISLFASNKRVNKIADMSGNHEMMLIFALIASGICRIIRNRKEQ